jgi:hypothetical protein
MSRAVLAWLLGLAASSAIGLPRPALAEPARTEPGGVELDRRSAAELFAAAREAFSALRYRDAVGLLERAWRRGDSSPTQLRAMFSLAGRAAASMGRDAAAELWFQRWLCLDPAAELPAGASPKLRGALSRARAALAGAALAVRAVRRGDEIELTLRDPLALAASVRTGTTRTPLSSLHVILPGVRGDGSRRGGVGDELELIDTYGNILVATAIEPASAGPPPPHPASPGDASAREAARHDAAWHDGWPPWAIAAGGFATLGVAAWWIADDADHQAHDTGDEDEEASLRRRRDVATWVSRGALVGMGVAIVGGIVVYVRGRDQQVIATPRPGGGGLAWRITF